jgi:hypothetical protein
MDILSDKETGSQNGISESAKSQVSGITEQVRAKHAGGRPKGTPAWNKGLKGGVGKDESKAKEPDKILVTEQQLEFVRESVAKAMEVTSNFCTNDVHGSIVALSHNLEPEAKRLADTVLIPPSEIALVSGAAKAVAENHPILVTYAPYAIIIGWMGTYAMRFMSVKKEIRLLRIAIQNLKGAGVQNVADPEHIRDSGIKSAKNNNPYIPFNADTP